VTRRCGSSIRRACSWPASPAWPTRPGGTATENAPKARTQRRSCVARRRVDVPYAMVRDRVPQQPADKPHTPSGSTKPWRHPAAMYLTGRLRAP
jgi:hypothetical protein